MADSDEEVVVFSGVFPLEDVEERNGLPLLRRRCVLLDGKRRVVRFDLMISASIALVGVEKSAEDEAVLVVVVIVASGALLFRLKHIDV